MAHTELIVTPLNNILLTTIGGYDSDILKRQSVTLQFVDSNGAAVIYDNDENALSGTNEKKVTCTGIITLDELLGIGILNSPFFMPIGGWDFLLNKRVDGDPEEPREQFNEAWVYKVETTTKFNKPRRKFPFGKDRKRRFKVSAVPNGGIIDLDY